MTRVTGPVSTASTHSAGYLGYCGYDPAAASLFAVTLRCGAGLPGYLLARAVTVVALHPVAWVTPTAARKPRKCWSSGAGNQVTSVTRVFACLERRRRFAAAPLLLISTAALSPIAAPTLPDLHGSEEWTAVPRRALGQWLKCAESGPRVARHTGVPLANGIPNHERASIRSG